MKTQIDYRFLHSTGEKKIKDQAMDIDQAKLDIEVLRDDILDFIDENEVINTDASESQIVISKLEEFRTSFRSKLRFIRQHAQGDTAEYDKMQDEILAQIKSHIKDTKDANAKYKLADQQLQMDALMQQEKVIEFQINEVSRGIMELESIFKNFVSHRTNKSSDGTVTFLKH